MQGSVSSVGRRAEARIALKSLAAAASEGHESTPQQANSQH